MQGSLKYGFYEIFKPQVCAELYHLDIILPDSTTGVCVCVCVCVCMCVCVCARFASPYLLMEQYLKPISSIQ